MRNLIVIDLEWNTASRKLKVDPELAAKMPFEIIEIGAVKLDNRLAPVETFHRRVRPELYTQLQYHIAQVTGRTQQSLGEGKPFASVAADLFDFAGEDPVFASWGTSDPDVLLSNLVFHAMNPIPAFGALNVQAVFSNFAEGTTRGNQRSIEYALDFLRMEKDLPFHEALSDALYAARILQTTLKPEQEAGGTPASLLGGFVYDPFLNRQLEERVELGKDVQVTEYLRNRSYACPACGRPVSGDWLEINPGKSWFAAGVCPEHGDIELTAKRARRSRVPAIMIRIRIPQGPLFIPQPASQKEPLVWVDPDA
jgi:inhibitor of KinA sporulation pathway (predicted exonuclease)